MWKYYYSEKQCQSYVSENNKKGGKGEPKCRTFVNGKEYTYATREDKLPPEFDDYILVLESQELKEEEWGAPY